MKLFKSREQKQQIDEARNRYAAFVDAAAKASPEQALSLAATFKSQTPVDSLSDREQRKRAIEAYRAYAANVLADDHLTEHEEHAFDAVGDALGIDDQTFRTMFADLIPRLVVAKANNGRLGQIESPHIITKRNEIVHLETAATLMKEVVLREFRGGSSGFSFRIAKGVYYRTGAVRGKSVVVGTQWQPEDAGVLSVTSSRVVFTGHRKTLETTYAKLISLNVYSDGIAIHASNRQRVPLFKINPGLGDAVAATINAAMQRLD